MKFQSELDHGPHTTVATVTTWPLSESHPPVERSKLGPGRSPRMEPLVETQHGNVDKKYMYRHLDVHGYIYIHIYIYIYTYICIYEHNVYYCISLLYMCIYIYIYIER